MSWTSTPCVLTWFRHISECTSLSPKNNACDSIQMYVSPVCGSSYAVAALTINMLVIGSYSCKNGVTSHSLPIYSMRWKVNLAQQVSACESSSMHAILSVSDIYCLTCATLLVLLSVHAFIQLNEYKGEIITFQLPCFFPFHPNWSPALWVISPITLNIWLASCGTTRVIITDNASMFCFSLSLICITVPLSVYDNGAHSLGE